MNDADRRSQFVAWFGGPPMNGDREALIRKSGLTKGRISQLFDPEQPFGERAARTLAQSLGLPSEFFNTPADATFTASEFTTVRRADVAAARRLRSSIPAWTRVTHGTRNLPMAFKAPPADSLM